MSTRHPTPQETAARVLAYLRGLSADRGAMAELRCALTPARRPRAWPLLAPIGGIDQPIHEAVAGLFAYHPEETVDGNLGTTCRRLAGDHDSFDARFRRLLACDRDELCVRLRPVVLAAKAQGIPVNYEVLFADLCYWGGGGGDRVRARWAREYWSVPPPREAASVTPAPASAPASAPSAPPEATP